MLKLPNNAFVTLKGIENCGLFELVRNKTKSDMFDPIKNLSIYLSKFSLESQCIFLHILTDLCAAKIADEKVSVNGQEMNLKEKYSHYSHIITRIYRKYPSRKKNFNSLFV